MTLLVALTWDPAPWVERFRLFLKNTDIVVLGEDFDREAVRYVATWGPRPGSLSNLPNLQAIFSLGAGVDHLMQVPDLPQVPIVRVAQDDLTFRMSEYVVMHCLMQLRDHSRYAAQQGRKIWRDERHPPKAADVRVGLLGFGVLGQDAAQKLKIMGFDVAGWSRSPKQVEGFRVYSEAERDAFLARTDILVSLLPLTPETKGILNRALFQKLAPKGALGGPVLINAGRGGLQVEDDILACLNENILKAAVLDVFEKEPLPDDSPIWTHPAVTVTPHNAAVSEPKATARYIAEQIARFEAGESFQNVVDRARGY